MSSSSGGSDWIGKLVAVLVGGAFVISAIEMLITAILNAITRLLWTLLYGSGVFLVLLAAAIFIILLAIHLRSHAQVTQLHSRIRGEKWSLRQIDDHLQHVRTRIQEKYEHPPEHPLLNFIKTTAIEGLRRQESVLVHELAALEASPKRARKREQLDGKIPTAEKTANGSHCRESDVLLNGNGAHLRQSEVDSRIRRREELMHDWQKEVRMFMGSRRFEELPPAERQLVKQIDGYYEEQLHNLYAQ